jgi:hypothetical protein
MISQIITLIHIMCLILQKVFFYGEHLENVPKTEVGMEF